MLEIGAGPGRFTIELARTEWRVIVTDVSPVQLSRHRRHVAEAGLEGALAERRHLDIRDLSSVPDASFDAVVAYGGTRRPQRMPPDKGETVDPETWARSVVDQSLI